MTLLCLLFFLPSPARAQGLNLQPTADIDLGDRSFIAGLSRELTAEIAQRTKTLNDPPKDDLGPIDRAYLALRRAALGLMRAPEPEIKLAGIVLAEERAHLEQLLATHEDPRGIAIFMAADFESLADAPALTLEQVDRTLRRALAELFRASLEPPDWAHATDPAWLLLFADPPELASLPSPNDYPAPDDQSVRTILQHADFMSQHPGLEAEAERLRTTLREIVWINARAESIPEQFRGSLRNAMAPALAELADPERRGDGLARVHRALVWVALLDVVARHDPDTQRRLYDPISRVAATPFSLPPERARQLMLDLRPIQVEIEDSQVLRELRPAFRVLITRFETAAADYFRIAPDAIADPNSIGVLTARRALDQAFSDATGVSTLAVLITTRDQRGRMRVDDRYSALARSLLRLGQQMSSADDAGAALRSYRVLAAQARALQHLHQTPGTTPQEDAWHDQAMSEFARVWAEGDSPETIGVRLEALHRFNRATGALAGLPETFARLRFDPAAAVFMPDTVYRSEVTDARRLLDEARNAFANTRDAEALVLMEEWDRRHSMLVHLEATHSLNASVGASAGIDPARLLWLSFGTPVSDRAGSRRRDTAQLSLLLYDLDAARNFSMSGEIARIESRIESLQAGLGMTELGAPPAGLRP